MKKTVLQHEGDFKLTLREVQRPLGFVTNQIEARETGVDIKSGDAKGVIVVPECGRGLAIRVGRWTRVEVRAVLAVRGEPGLRIAVIIWQRACTMKVSDIANRSDSRFCSVDRVIDREKMCGRKPADPFDVDGAATLRFDGRAGPRTVVAPYRGGGDLDVPSVGTGAFRFRRSHRACQLDGLQVGWGADRRTGPV